MASRQTTIQEKSSACIRKRANSITKKEVWLVRQHTSKHCQNRNSEFIRKQRQMIENIGKKSKLKKRESHILFTKTITLCYGASSHHSCGCNRKISKLFSRSQHISRIEEIPINELWWKESWWKIFLKNRNVIRKCLTEGLAT